jgi:hypothetical protein
MFIIEAPLINTRHEAWTRWRSGFINQTVRVPAGQPDRVGW